MRRIASRQNPIVARYREAAHGGGHDLLLDGAHLVADALACGVRIADAAVTTEAGDRPEIRTLVDRLVNAGVDVASVTGPVMAALSPVRSSSGIVAIGERPDRSASIYGDGRIAPLVLVAIAVQDPGNLGALVRVAEAAGATGIVAAGASANPYSWKALRGSMGSALRLPIAVDPRVSCLDELRRRRCRVVATVPRAGTPLFEADLDGPLAILVGGEGAGLPPESVAEADIRVSIPMETPVESLNTAVSAALLAYEARRQRQRVRIEPAAVS
jgi:TrmH family RNA methyltransferase